MSELLLAFIALAAMFCAIGLITIAFVVFKIFIGYKEYFGEVIDWYFDVAMPKAMEKTLGNLFKDEEETKEQKEDGAE